MRGTIARGVLPPCAGSHVVAGMSTRRLLVPAGSVSNDCTRKHLVAANPSNDSTTRRQCWPQPSAISSATNTSTDSARRQCWPQPSAALHPYMYTHIHIDILFIYIYTVGSTCLKCSLNGLCTSCCISMAPLHLQICVAIALRC